MVLWQLTINNVSWGLVPSSSDGQPDEMKGIQFSDWFSPLKNPQPLVEDPMLRILNIDWIPRTDHEKVHKYYTFNQAVNR